MTDYSVLDKEIRVSSSDFNAGATLECGQVFRFEPCDGGFRVFSRDKTALIVEKGGETAIITDAPDYFVKYFDLDRDYDSVRQLIPKTGFLGEACEFGKGIRILKQDAIETIISFLISANNNIKRIKAIISRLAEAAGEPIEAGFAFPTLSALRVKDEAFYISIGCGYRSAYLAQTVQTLAETDIAMLCSMPDGELKKILMSCKGIGEKVAHCIMLYGFQRWNVFPVDTWIFKVFSEQYGGKGSNPASAARFFAERFGELSGLVQQYMFYYRRNSK